MTRAFKAYETTSQFITEISSTRSEDLTDSNLGNLINFIKEYIYAFASNATGVSYIRSFDLELVRMITYLIRYGLFIYRDNRYQSEDVDLIFSFLCHICDIFTSRSYIKKLHMFDKIISKDTILTDISKMNQIQRAAYDIKYLLFNKNYSDEEHYAKDLNDYQDKADSKHFLLKLLKEIITIFHLFNDLRQHYLISNNVEFFYTEIYSPNFSTISCHLSDEDFKKFNQVMKKEFIHLIPDADRFHNHLAYELPSIDEMYAQNELDEYKKNIFESNNMAAAEMHGEFVTLMIDTFNTHSQDPFLRQLTALLISRYHSERAEFVRNLDRTLLFFDESDYLYYKWTTDKMVELVKCSEKSNIWLMKVKKLLTNVTGEWDEVTTDPSLPELLEILQVLKRSIIYHCKIMEMGGKLQLICCMGERKTNAFSQDLFRNCKVYDYLIDFILQNKELYLAVRKIKYEDLKEGQVQIIKTIRSVFRKAFRVLEEMTVGNAKTQDLMWKYKEVFVFEELEDIETEGELEFTLSIINDTPEAIKLQQNRWTLTKTRYFVNLLNKRVGGKENFILVLEIYNKLIKFEAISFLKQSLTKMILMNPKDIHSHGFTTRREFEKSLNIQEIIYSIIHDQDMPYIRDFLKEQFPLANIFTEVEGSMQKLDWIEQIKEDDYDEQDFEELRNYTHIALLNIYTELYLNPKYSNTSKDTMLSSFMVLAPKYVRSLNDLNNKSDFDRGEGYKKSEISFLLVHMHNFLKRFKRYMDYQADRNLSFREKDNNFKHRSSFRTNKSEDSDSDNSALMEFKDPRQNINHIESLTGEILGRMEISDHEKVLELNEEIMSRLDNLTHDGSVSAMRESRSLRGVKTMRVEIVGKGDDNTNLRSQLSFNFSLIWKEYVETVVTSRDSRQLIDNEHLNLVNLMYNTLTSRTANHLVIQSFKTFISTSIDYVYTCEKANWTLYITVFIFKINSMLLKL